MTEKASETTPSPAAKSPTATSAAAKSPTATSPAEKSPAGKSPSPAPNPSSPTGILPAEHWAQQPLDDDTESAIGESIDLSTASVTSSILKYRMMHGRRYHSEVGNASYWGPNDEKQNESWDFNHYSLMRGCGDKLYFAPLEKGKLKKALDIGTGNGIWAIDFADEHPETEVIGTDISPIQPTWAPPNLKFEIEDFTQPWTFAENSVDYIYMRFLFGSIENWDNLFAEAYKTCRPGGWFESYEASAIATSDDMDIPDSAAISQWTKFLVEGGKKTGRTFTVVDDGLQRKAMEKAGFVDIQEHNWKRPLGTWPKDPVLKEVGGLTQLTIESDADGYIMFLANMLGWTEDEVIVYVAHLRREIRSNKYHVYWPQKIIWGRKPE